MCLSLFQEASWASACDVTGSQEGGHMRLQGPLKPVPSSGAASWLPCLLAGGRSKSQIQRSFRQGKLGPTAANSCLVAVHRAWGRGDGGHCSPLQTAGKRPATLEAGPGQEGDPRRECRGHFWGFKGSMVRCLVSGDGFCCLNSDLPKINTISIKITSQLGCDN